MKKLIHREGKSYAIILSVLNVCLFTLFAVSGSMVWMITFFMSFFTLVFVLQFFRVPSRSMPEINQLDVLCPADGKVVVVETLANGHLQISIFMSPLNVHINWVPIDGKVVSSDYIPGHYLVAWHPKSSEENERHVTTIQTPGNQRVIVKQIAGAVARRVCNYAQVGHKLTQGQELGFIKFGSRVDLILPPQSNSNVNVGDKVVGRETIIARLA